jgi:WD40-like Beta Propeller Repeat
MGYNLEDQVLTQLTFGPGPDLQPMPDPGGRGILFVNGRESGFLTAYQPRTKSSVDLVSENATQPTISPDRKRLMFLKILGQSKMELWVSDIDGANPLKLASSGRLSTLGWSPDGSQLAFADNTTGTGKVFLVGADGRGLHAIEGTEGFAGFTVWSPDRKTIYISSSVSDEKSVIWTTDPEGSRTQRFLEDCCAAVEASSDGNHLLGLRLHGEKTGIYQISLKEKKFIPLVLGVAPFGAHYSPDGKSVLYPVESHGQITFYRQLIQGEEPIGKPQVALTLPFTFPLIYKGNAFDFSPDLSTVVYARPGGQADFYLLSEEWMLVAKDCQFAHFFLKVKVLRVKSLFVLSNAHGEISAMIKDIVDYDPKAEVEALDQLKKGDRFIVEWFNTAPDVQESTFKITAGQIASDTPTNACMGY